MPYDQPNALCQNTLGGVHPGPDTDALSDMSDRFDYCHFSERGLQAHAALWKDVIVSFAQGHQ
jgi:hypothetical protein